MSTQVITIKPDGSVFGLDHKRKGLQLRQLGRAETTRVTLIEWNVDRQAWFIQWTATGVMWTPETFQEAGVSASDFHGMWARTETLIPVVHFEDYEDANAAEVAVIQALQKKGHVG